MSRLPARTFSLFLAVAVFWTATSGCLQEETSIHFGDALSELQASIDYKAKECGSRPANPLIPPKETDEHALHLCSITIVREKCPFNEYPLFCAEMFLKLPGLPK